MNNETQPSLFLAHEQPISETGKIIGDDTAVMPFVGGSDTSRNAEYSGNSPSSSGSGSGSGSGTSGSPADNTNQSPGAGAIIGPGGGGSGSGGGSSDTSDPSNENEQITAEEVLSPDNLTDDESSTGLSLTGTLVLAICVGVVLVCLAASVLMGIVVHDNRQRR